MSHFNSPHLQAAIHDLLLPLIDGRVISAATEHSAIARETERMLLESNSNDAHKLTVTLLAGVISQVAQLSISLKTSLEEIKGDIRHVRSIREDRWNHNFAPITTRLTALQQKVDSLPSVEELAKAVPKPPPPPAPVVIRQPAPAPPPPSNPNNQPKQAKKAKKSYASAAAASTPPPPQQNAAKTKTAQNRKATGTPAQKEKALPTARRRFFATRSTPTPIPEAEKLTATLPVILGQFLERNNQKAPVTSLSVSINQRGTVSILAPPTVPTTTYAPFFEAFTGIVNAALKSPDNPLTTFRPAPTDVDIAIHGIPLFAFQDKETLDASFPECINLATGVAPSAVRFLNPNTTTRNAKATSSVVITVSADDAPKFSSTVRLFSRPRRCSTMIPATPKTQCRNCCQFGHPTQLCKNETACAICTLNHDLNDHRCPVLSCPGAKWPMENCCEVSPAKCVNCNGPHRAFNPACPTRLALIKPSNLSAPPPTTSGSLAGSQSLHPNGNALNKPSPNLTTEPHP